MSSVQSSRSSQLGAAPLPAQAPLLHASTGVQGSPSLHWLVLGMCSHVTPLAPGVQMSSVQKMPSLHAPACKQSPVASSHESTVHGLSSSQLGGPWPTQAPLAHASLEVHASKSSQGSASNRGVWVQAPLMSHMSSVHVLSSSQAPSWSQPLAGLHESVVHGSLSSQSRPAAPMQSPPAHRSTEVHALLSLHASLLGSWTQPRWGSQRSSVHGLSSLQGRTPLPVQVPPTQRSVRVQASWSLQAVALLVCSQPVVTSHLSFVQGLPSTHGQSLGVWAQPVVGSQVSMVHETSSLQVFGAPGWQAPPAQVSPLVQAL